MSVSTVNDFESFLHCDYCSNKFKLVDDPKIMPCGITICTECDLEIDNRFTTERFFKCLNKSCSLEHYKPELGFVSNKLIQFILEQPTKKIVDRIKNLKVNVNEMIKLVNKKSLDEEAFEMNNSAENQAELSEETLYQIKQSTSWVNKRIDDFNRENFKEKVEPLPKIVIAYPDDCVYKPPKKIKYVQPEFDYITLRNECIK